MLEYISSDIALSKQKISNSFVTCSKTIADRDHRIINKQLDLYHMQEEAPGMVFWHKNGWIIFRELENFIRIKLKDYQYQEVKGPLMIDHTLWKKTGHWDNYASSIFTTSSEDRKYCIKPMNCPGHIQIFNQGFKSYRDLPLRMAEFGSCHRNEPSGSLHGLMRLRSFTQDDAHIFCSEKQVSMEINNCIKMIYDIYTAFGFTNIIVKLSTRPINRIGDDNIWNWAENILSSILKNNNIYFEYQPGEGAFYGPKIEFTLQDSLNRFWQCGTIQLDFSLPKYLRTFYIDENNKRITPVIIHRAILGSIERFIGILTEEYAGLYPTWLAPVQVVIMNITINQLNYVLRLTEKMLMTGIRVISDTRNEKIGFKIREHTIHKIPYMIICGDKEMVKSKISVRTCHGKNLGQFNFNDIIMRLKSEIHNRDLHQMEG